jgi:hypothetical protein
MFKTSFSKKTVVIVVVNNEIFFILFDPHGDAHIFQKVSLDQFLSHSIDYTPIATTLRNKTDSLLILPDHWSGNTSYLFQSKKRSLAKMFIERNLLTEYPDLHDIKHFFDFTFSQTGMQDLKVNVFFLQNPQAFKLYQKLSEINLSPARISTPALLWEQKLIKILPDFNIGGTCLVHLLSLECFLYFFFQGRLLFSRSIAIPDFQPEPAKNSSDLSFEPPNHFSVLTYEINQSLYLFSQKTKSDIDNIYLLSSDIGNTQLLSDTLGREVIDFGIHVPALEGLQESPGISENLGSVGSFDTVDLSPSKLHLNLTHSSLKKMLEWKPVQTVGLVVGLFLIFLLAMESLFLWKWPHASRDQMVKNGSLSGINQKQIIRQYSEALDQILAETNCPSPRKVIINIGRSIPDNTWITDMDIETEINPAVIINGAVRVSGADQLKDTFSILLKNLNRYFQGTRSLSIQDIDFKVDKSTVEKASNNFLFTLKFNLP